MPSRPSPTRACCRARFAGVLGRKLSPSSPPPAAQPGTGASLRAAPPPILLRGLRGRICGHGPLRSPRGGRRLTARPSSPRNVPALSRDLDPRCAPRCAALVTKTRGPGSRPGHWLLVLRGISGSLLQPDNAPDVYAIITFEKSIIINHLTTCATCTPPGTPPAAIFHALWRAALAGAI